MQTQLCLQPGIDLAVQLPVQPLFLSFRSFDAVSRFEAASENIIAVVWEIRAVQVQLGNGVTWMCFFVCAQECIVQFNADCLICRTVIGFDKRILDMFVPPLYKIIQCQWVHRSKLQHDEQSHNLLIHIIYKNVSGCNNVITIHINRIKRPHVHGEAEPI